MPRRSSNVEIFAPLKPFDQWPADFDQGKTNPEIAERVRRGIAGDRLQLLAIYPGQCRGGALRRKRRQLGKDRRTQPGDAGIACRRYPAANEQVKGIADLGDFSRAWSAESQHQDRSCQGRALRAQYRRRQYCRPSSARRQRKATTLLEGDRQFNLAVRLPPKYRTSIERNPYYQGRISNSARHQRLCSVERTRRYLARYRCLLHLSRGKRTLHSDQVQRSRSRSRRRSRGSAAARCRKREASDRLSDPLGRRVRRSGECESASCRRRADHPAFHSSCCCIRPVQFDARQFDGGRRHPVCDRRRPDRALSLRPEF